MPPVLCEQRGLLPLSVSRVYNLQSCKQLNVDQGHRPAPRPCLLGVGIHHFHSYQQKCSQRISAYCRHSFFCCHIKQFCDWYFIFLLELLSSGGSRRRGVESVRAGLLIMFTLVKPARGSAADTATVPADRCASVMRDTMVGHRLCGDASAVLLRGKSLRLNFITSSSPGDDCSLSSNDLPSSIKDNFESGGVSPESWQSIQGGGVGNGCGQLSPHAHGDSLYFNGCKMRQAVTKPLDLTRARYRYYQNTQYCSSNSEICHKANVCLIFAFISPSHWFAVRSCSCCRLAAWHKQTAVT